MSARSRRRSGTDNEPLLPTNATTGPSGGYSSPQHTDLFGSAISVATSTKLNFLLIAVPFGILSHYLGWSDVLTFWLNFVAIIPMAHWLSLATEEISLHTSETLGGLINATFGNAVELIISIMALSQGYVTVVQNSLLGSVLSNSLLVLGLCFFCGGVRHPIQKFNATAAQTSGSLLMLAVLSLLIPAGLNIALGSDERVGEKILILSHGTAICLLVIYFLYLVFQMKTHRLYFFATHAVSSSTQIEEPEQMQYPLWFSVGLLVFATGVISWCSDFLVGSIEGLNESWGISQTFVGLVLLPIVGNAAEHASAVTVAMKNKMDLALGIAVGSSMQIALLVTPILVIAGWLVNTPMTLLFAPFQTIVLFISVTIVVSLIQDGESNWLEGAMLISAYFIIGLSIWLIPDPEVPGDAKALHPVF